MNTGRGLCEDHGVYILLGAVDGLIVCKVGMSSYIQTRIYQVCQVCPFQLSHAFTLGARSRLYARVAERAILRMLRRYRMKGEWFILDPNDSDQKSYFYECINTVAGNYGMPKTSISIPELRSAVATVRSAREAANAEQRKLAARSVKVRQQERDIRTAQRRAKVRQFEEDSRRQRSEALAGRTVMA